MPRKKDYICVIVMKTFLIIIVTVLSCVTAGAQVKIGDSPFYEAMRELPLQEREQMICKEILSGNVPEYMYGFIAIKTIQRDAAGKKHRVTLYVKPDYLTIGGNNNTVPFIIPMTPRTAQQIADSLDCSLPTPKIVDLIYLAAKMKLNPFNYIPRGVRNSDPDLFFDHSQVIFAQVKAAGGTPGQLVAGIKKRRGHLGQTFRPATYTSCNHLRMAQNRRQAHPAGI